MLTNKGKYGLKAMVHLAGMPPGGRRWSPRSPRPTRSRRSFSTRFSANCARRVLCTQEGRGGGYVLARPATEIMVGAIIRSLDGPLAPIGCASRTSYRRCEDCALDQPCSVRLVMVQVRESIAAVLDLRSLAEMRQIANPAEEAIT